MLSYVGSFTSRAKILVVDYDNGLLAPPYVGARPGSDKYHRPFFNAPWYYDIRGTLPQNSVYPFIPVAGDLANSENGMNIFSWPNLKSLAWGRTPYESAYLPKAVSRVIVWDTNNVNPNLRCFDATPFFAIEEASCQFCYDTDGRVTDGNIHTSQSQDNVLPCCDLPPLRCAYIGSGTTKFYLTVKFNNSQDNPLPAVYYNSSLYRAATNSIATNVVSVSVTNVADITTTNFTIVTNVVSTFAKKLSWTDLGAPTSRGLVDATWSFGSYLSENNAILANNTSQSKDSLLFAVSGVVEYPWSYVNSVSLGTMTMPYADGFGQNPFCGVFRGQLTIGEVTGVSLSCYKTASYIFQSASTNIVVTTSVTTEPIPFLFR